MTIGVMSCCDVFLNKKHTDNIPGVCQKVMTFLGTLGLTKTDMLKVSPKLVSQINAVDGSQKGQHVKGKKRPSTDSKNQPPETEDPSEGETPAAAAATKKQKKDSKRKEPKEKKSRRSGGNKRKGVDDNDSD